MARLTREVDDTKIEAQIKENIVEHSYQATFDLNWQGVHTVNEILQEKMA